MSKESWLNKLRTSLAKTSSNLSKGIKDLFYNKKLTSNTLEQLTDLLLSTDLGVEVTELLISKIAAKSFKQNISEEEVKEILANTIAEILQTVVKQIAITHKPHIILMCGVNGNGKTTTIGKLAWQYRSCGKQVVLAGCDTFRAAANEQLSIWAERADCEIVKGERRADSASIAYQAIDIAKQKKKDIVLIDTAGRLHTQTNFMDELAKILRVIRKHDADAPHNKILVLDATTGQNAYKQVDIFKQFTDINGLIITKLDGTAKGGVVVGIAKKHALPIHYIGIGEKIDDLKEFSAIEFGKSLVGL